MRFSLAIFLLTSVACTFAQIFQIGAPAPGAKLKAGKPFVIQVEQPNSLGPIEPISVAIGLQRCGSSPCSNDSDDGILGQILFAGNFQPQRHEVFLPPYQNYTVTLNDTQSGFGTLHVTGFFLIGAGPSPQIATRNVSVTIKGEN
ncbi:hypothetical protein M422DRAFT_30728 [Sphaerobolus stellatus SS14]|uniref:Uncharacterized protein n=1 Tax=Sphaerobolus stellatus (strain SS14) TaxID=990650 RepID=A0A0C9VAF0_SPHS4|nr:hypothetical protein M422DRAFT_30728 [Sphaerobolus stellatus SS14]